jgi:nickel/cobalt transporter (NicO) family protein
MESSQKEWSMSSKRLRSFLRYSPAVLLSLIPDPALAHLVNTDVGVFYAGMMHPLASAEHLLPTVAVALLAGQLGKQAARSVVLLFPVALAAGMLIGSYYAGFEFVQTINLVQLVVLGGLLIVAASVPPVVMPVVAVTTGLILGYRSGVDMVASSVGMRFIPGVALTGLIIMLLFAAWVPEASSMSARLIRGLLGGVFSLTGMVLLFVPVAGLDLQNIRSVRFPGQEDIVSKIMSKDLSLTVILTALTGSLIWGAGHALTPGHGKAVVAAYLVGARSTPWHAVCLGLTVTATHTLVVFALGLISLLASCLILPDQLYPWLGLLSGLIVTGMGAAIAISRLRRLKDIHLREYQQPHDHAHDHVHSRVDGDHACDHHHSYNHSHLPHTADDVHVTWKGLLGLGVSGGLLPCPAALVLLLTAISVGRVGLGMILVSVFSLGLAGVLITVGLLFIKGGRLLAQVPQGSVFSGWFPVVSSLLVFGLGVLITIRAAALI